MIRCRVAHALPHALALVALAFGLACVAPEDDGGANAERPLVPADAAALQRYLEAAVTQQLPSERSLPVFDLTAAPLGGPSSSGAGFSTTTLQTAGVDEADLVKFDGETLFVARQPVYHWGAAAGTVTIVMPEPPDVPEPEIEPAEIAVYAAQEDPAETMQVATIPLPDADSVDGMLLLPARGAAPPLLVVVGSDHVDVWPSPWMRPATDALFYSGEARVRLWIFDVSEPSAPRSLHRSRLEGSLVAVRRIGEQLVLVTRFTPYVSYLPFEGEALPGAATAVSELDVQDLLPRRWMELPEEPSPQPLVRPTECFVPRARADDDASLYYQPTLVTVSTIDLRRPDEPVSICAAGPVDRIYSSTRALYLAATSWTAAQTTFVHKFAYTERGPEFRGSGSAAGLPGGSDPDFGLGETGDVLGIMTTISGPTPEGGFDSAPRLTLLAEAGDGSRTLRELSHLPNPSEPDRIGKPGEQLYAVRFLGDRVFAVTFRRIDPLYVIDIGDPRHPFIAGELKIPGFSDRLEPIAPDLLLGVGKHSVAQAGVDWFQGVKVELFDVSDPSAPTSVDAIVVGRRGSETEARTDHHALSTLDMGDGTSRVAMPLSVADVPDGEIPSPDPTVWYPWRRTGLHLFEVDHARRALRAAGALIVAEAGVDGASSGTWRDRSRLQGDAVHYVHDGRVWSAPWARPEDAVGPN